MNMAQFWKKIISVLLEAVVALEIYVLEKAGTQQTFCRVEFMQGTEGNDGPTIIMIYIKDSWILESLRHSQFNASGIFDCVRNASHTTFSLTYSCILELFVAFT